MDYTFECYYHTHNDIVLLLSQLVYCGLMLILVYGIASGTGVLTDAYIQLYYSLSVTIIHICHRILCFGTVYTYFIIICGMSQVE